MNSRYHISPWYNTEEWIGVYINIFGNTSTLTTKQSALDQLLIWKARCPSLPSGVEATMSLLNVLIQDQGEHEICSDQILRLAYSSALMRFVNHMFDKETAKGVSLFQAAKTLGVPEWIIELRHDTAHSNKLAHIELLREASAISFNWLQENYWEKHKLCISDYTVGKVYNETTMYTNETETERKITALMNFCVSLSICSHPKCKIKTLASITDANLRDNLIKDAKELLEDSLDTTNLKIVSINSLKHSINLQGKKILNNEMCSSYVNRVLLSEDSAFLSLELFHHLDFDSYMSDKPLKSDYVHCFDGLLTFLLKHNLLRDFLLELIKITQNENDNSVKKCKLAAKWVSVILKALRKKQQFMEKINKSGIDITSKDERDLKCLYFHWNPNDRERALLADIQKPIPKEFTNINFIQPIISTYNSYLVFFINDLLNLVRPQLPDDVNEKICQLVKVIASPEKFPLTSTRIYTADDIEMAISIESIENIENKDVEVIEVQTEDKGNDTSTTNFGIWKVAPKNVDWVNCPIGQLPWAQVTSGSMDTQ